MIILPILTTSLIHLSLKGLENVLFGCEREWQNRCVTGYNRFSSFQKTVDVRLACDEDSGWSGALLLYCTLYCVGLYSSLPTPSLLLSVCLLFSSLPLTYLLVPPKTFWRLEVLGQSRQGILGLHWHRQLRVGERPSHKKFRFAFNLS